MEGAKKGLGWGGVTSHAIGECESAQKIVHKFWNTQCRCAQTHTHIRTQMEGVCERVEAGGGREREQGSIHI